jgi:DNA-binding NarL/FixJ family response regulator
MPKIKLLICNTSPMFRRGMRALLDGSPLEIIGETGAANVAVEQVRRLKPDAVLMDITPHKISAADAIRRIKKISPQVNVFVMTLHDDHENLIANCIQAGASGFIGRDVQKAQLEAQIGALYARRPVESPKAA